MKDFIQTCIDASKEVLNLINLTPHERLCERFEVGFGGDISCLIDIKAEEIFAKYLGKYGQIISEESGIIGAENSTKIIIDPIDGSDNFISQIPYYGTSIALIENGITKKAFVCNLANGDIFAKENGVLKMGSLHVNGFRDILLNPFSCVGIFESAYKSEIYAKRLKSLKIKFRSPGALALSLAYAGGVDFVLYEGKPREFDIAAGWSFCEHLYQIKTNNYIFVSKDKQTFDKISQKILKVG